GSFFKKDGKWVKSSRGQSGKDASAKDRMRDVLSLISAEQFRAITEAANTAVLIQGIAGSGKTTVALHRLAWLLDPFNSELKADECLVLAQTSSLKTYIKNTLDGLNVENIKVQKFDEWTSFVMKEIFPEYGPNFLSPCPSSIDRVKK